VSEITHAFLRLQTEADLFDVIALLKRGVRVCIEPVVGGIFGPISPCQYGGEIKPTTQVLRLSVTGLEDFLRSYFAHRVRFQILMVEAEQDEPAIREIWEILNHAAEYPLRAVGIAKLTQILARTFGGSVELQLPYGHPEWTAWVKEGHGHLTFWHRPSLSELADIVRFGCRGIVRADAHREWYRGGLDFPFPDRGTLTQAEMPLEAAYEAAGGPSGIGPLWDTVRANHRLMGLLCGPETPTITRNEIRVRLRTIANKARTAQSVLVITAHGSCTTGDLPPDVDRLFVAKAVEPGVTAAWLSDHWASLKVVTLTE
jgi:hypothetical protein